MKSNRNSRNAIVVFGCRRCNGNLSLTGFTPLEIKKKCYRLFQHFRSKKRECSNIASSLRSDTSELSLTGFTLLELLTVIAIISLLAAMIFPTLGKVRMRARKAKVISELKTIELALMDYYTEFSGFPTNDILPPLKSGLYKLFEEDYLDTALADAFKNSQSYTYYDCSDGTIDTADSCIVFSVGPDRQENTAANFEKALEDAYPPGETEPDSDNIYLVIDPSGKEGDIRYKQ